MMLTFTRLTAQISMVSLLSASPLCEELKHKGTEDTSLPLGFCKFNRGGLRNYVLTKNDLAGTGSYSLILRKLVLAELCE